MKIIVYSTNIGNYDMLWSPKNYDINARYILFTDNKYFKSDVWEVNHVDFLNEKNLSNRHMARYVKTNPHLILPEHDVSIWVDNCFKFKFNDSKKLLNDIEFEDKDVMLYRHDVRNCIYDEAKVVKKHNLDDHDIVNTQVQTYSSEGFPKQMGLYSTGFMVRKNNEKVNTFNEFWWEQINKYSGRDQLSQMYSSWVTKTTISPINNNGDVYNNNFLEPKIKHLKSWTK